MWWGTVHTAHTQRLASYTDMFVLTCQAGLVYVLAARRIADGTRRLTDCVRAGIVMLLHVSHMHVIPTRLLDAPNTMYKHTS